MPRSTKWHTSKLGQQCEAYFYAGSKQLLEGHEAVAEDYFRKSLATKRADYLEYASAAAELKFLTQGK